jgi:hypothetical protein
VRLRQHFGLVRSEPGGRDEQLAGFDVVARSLEIVLCRDVNAARLDLLEDDDPTSAFHRFA